MRKENAPYTDLRKARTIGAGLEQDIRHVRNYGGDSTAFYEAMRQRAFYDLGEIRQYFGYRLFPEGARTPMTLEEWQEPTWKFHVQRAFACIDLANKAIKLHILAANGMRRLLKEKEKEY